MVDYKHVMDEPGARSLLQEFWVERGYIYPLGIIHIWGNNYQPRLTRVHCLGPNGQDFKDFYLRWVINLHARGSVQRTKFHESLLYDFLFVNMDKASFQVD